MNQDFQDKIDQYLLGQMSEEARLAFKKEIETDTELREQFEFTRDVKKVITDRNRRLAQIREWEQDYKNKKKSRPAKRQYFYWISGIAAIFIVGFFLFSPVYFDKNDDMSNPVPMSQGSLRCSEDNSSIEKALEDGNFDSALAQIEERERCLEVEKAETEREKSNMDNEEYTYLQEVYKIQYDELHMLKAYALIGLKRNNEAINILDELRQKDSPFKLQADSLYNQYK